MIINDQTPLPRFRWIFLDESNDEVFVDLIILSLFTGYIGASVLLTITSLLSKIYPFPVINSVITFLLLLTSIAPFILKNIKTSQTPPFFDIGSNN